MTTVPDFQKYCSERTMEFSFSTLAGMLGGVENAFKCYLEGSLDQDLKDWVLLNAPDSLTAFTMTQLAQFEASSFFSIMGMLNQINMNLKDIKAGMKALLPPAKVQ